MIDIKNYIVKRWQVARFVFPTKGKEETAKIHVLQLITKNGFHKSSSRNCLLTLDPLSKSSLEDFYRRLLRGYLFSHSECTLTSRDITYIQISCGRGKLEKHTWLKLKFVCLKLGKYWWLFQCVWVTLHGCWGCRPWTYCIPEVSVELFKGWI